MANEKSNDSEKNINWLELYDTLTERYKGIERMLQESKRAMERTTRDVEERVRKDLLEKICNIGDNLDRLAKAANSQKAHGDTASMFCSRC